MQYHYPLQMNFKILAIAPQIFIRDAGGREVFYVHMKAFKLKEDISIFTDSTKSNQVFRIQADRILDFSAEYHITDTMAGSRLGSVKREGMRSLWKASYNIMDGMGQRVYHIKEDNPWIKVADALLAEIPVVGIASAFLFHPSYTVYRAGVETSVMRLTKQAAFFESKFGVEMLDPSLGESDERLILLSTMMMILLERARG